MTLLRDCIADDGRDDNATPPAAGAPSLGYLSSSFPGCAGLGVHYAITSQVQWVTFNSDPGSKRAAAAAKPMANSFTDLAPAAQPGRADRNTVGTIRHGSKESAPGQPSSALSDREKSCLSWTALGKSSWEIGRILSISENTVVFHIKNAMRKLGVSNRTLAALRAVQLGLIEPAVEAESNMRRCAPES